MEPCTLVQKGGKKTYCLIRTSDSVTHGCLHSGPQKQANQFFLPKLDVEQKRQQSWQYVKKKAKPTLIYSHSLTAPGSKPKLGFNYASTVANGIVIRMEIPDFSSLISLPDRKQLPFLQASANLHFHLEHNSKIFFIITITGNTIYCTALSY